MEKILKIQYTGRGELENPYLELRYKIMFFMPIPNLIDSFSTFMAQRNWSKHPFEYSKAAETEFFPN